MSKNDNARDISNYRIRMAKEDLDTAAELLESGRYKGAVNRAYYAVFHSIRAILALDGVDFSKHSGVIAYFRQNYIKTEIFHNELSNVIQRAALMRTESDYSDFYIATEDEAREMINGAFLFYSKVVEFLRSKGQ